MQDVQHYEFGGFWQRLGATLVDAILIVLITFPVLWMIYGNAYFDSDKVIQGPADFVISYVLPLVATITLWHRFRATPGKMALGLVVVDAKTGQAPSMGQCVGRYFAYILSTIPLCLGFFWVAFDAKKRGWHDMLAGTVVIKTKSAVFTPAASERQEPQV